MNSLPDSSIDLSVAMISVQNISYSYPGSKRTALSGITFDIQEGSFVAITGGNGSGKSTLARCLNGLLTPTVGQVLIDGLSTLDPGSLPAIRKAVGLVFQDPNNQLTSPTVERELAFGLQNTGIPPGKIRVIVEDALLRLSLPHKRLLPPSTLSGGEKQRLAIEAVRLLRPKYLVLDEATAFLSPKWRRIILNEIIELYKNQIVTVIFITQYLQEIQVADRLIVIEDGIVTYDGKPTGRHQQERILEV